MSTFYGYGTWSAKLWFVGMEEGGGDTQEEIGMRLDAWSGADLQDLRDFHKQLKGTDWFSNRPPIQSTWSKLIRIALCAGNRPSDTEAVRLFQRDELGRRDGNTALIELFPLPSPSTQHWTYGACGIPALATREIYRDSMAASRMKTIQDRIDAHKPTAVIFYGRSYRHYWEEIAGAPFTAIHDTRFEVTHRNATLLILARHPVATGVRNADFCAIGQYVAD